MNKSHFAYAVVLGLVFSILCFAQAGKPTKPRYVEYDESGNVPIATAATGSKLAVGGVIESTSGGFKFPDGSTQTKAGITQIYTSGSITGNGTAESPLTVQTTASGGDPEASRQPFNKKFLSNAGIQNSTILDTVPAGKILIIEFATGYTGLPNTSSQPGMSLTIDGAPVVYLSPRTVFTSAAGFVLWNYSDPIKLRATAGQVLGASFHNPGGENLISVNGYYVNVP